MRDIKRVSALYIIYFSISIFAIFLTGCDQIVVEENPETFSEYVPEKSICDFQLPDLKYTLENVFHETIDDKNHCASVKLCKITFNGYNELSSAVNEIIYDKFIEEYNEYMQCFPVEWNWFSTEYQVFEDDKYLSVSVISHQENTFITYPHISSSTIDLSSRSILSLEQLLQCFGINLDIAEQKIYKLLPAVNDIEYPVYCKSIDQAYIDPTGDLILYCSAIYPRFNINTGSLLYNVHDDALCVLTNAESFGDIKWLTYPSAYVYDEQIMSEYYKENYLIDHQAEIIIDEQGGEIVLEEEEIID